MKIEFKICAKYYKACTKHYNIDALETTKLKINLKKKIVALNGRTIAFDKEKDVQRRANRVQ